MYYQKYVLFKANLRDKIDLTTYADEIKGTIKSQLDDAYSIKVAKDYYSFETKYQPTKGDLRIIGRNISYTTSLYKFVTEYPSKNGKHSPTRKLFKCVDKDY